MSRMTDHQDQKREERASALWGSGAKGGKGRTSAMFGGRTRGAAALLTLAVGLSLPAAGLAAGHGRGVDNSVGVSGKAFVPAALLADAQANPRKLFQVIVQTDLPGISSSDPDIERVAKSDGGRHKRSFRSFNGGSYDVTGKHLLRLASQDHVTTITPDATLSRTSYVDSEMWRETAGLLPLAGTVEQPAPQAPGIAIVDSGIDATKVADFGGRVVASVNFSSLSALNATGDDQGHGTMVAGIAAGSSAAHPGAAANANLIDVRTADVTGHTVTSDLIAAIDWIIANKDTYNIRVANFSMASDVQTSFRFDPIDRAVEKLWFNGIVVVAAAGNHGLANTGVDMSFAPGNDPFVITVGATDQQMTAVPGDDTLAPWSAYGHSVDGFSKPDVSAPGRYLIMPVPAAAALPLALPDRVVAPGYMWMSGTSFSAPAVAGAAAQLLARHPAWTPDEVKGALMVSAHYLPNAGFSGGVGEVDAEAANAVASPPNPNANLNAFVATDPNTGQPTFNQASWSEAASTQASWSSANWSEASWSSASWSEASWSSASWSEASWSSASWSEASWSEASWAAASWNEANWAE